MKYKRVNNAVKLLSRQITTVVSKQSETMWQVKSKLSQTTTRIAGWLFRFSRCSDEFAVIEMSLQ